MDAMTDSMAGSMAETVHSHAAIDPLIFSITVFVLAVFVGYHVVWNVTPALHTPLMSLTNAISSIIIVGAILAAAPLEMNLPTVLGLVAVGLAGVNIFGGFLVTQRMLAMFRKRDGGK
ncbi:MAG: NAD(P) transhydrogenase subunit alpha [Mariprofundales bacterium]